MIYPLISALTLMSKIGICIAVFALLIIIEIAALIMLVKWKKNFKPMGTQKDGADASEQTKQEMNDQTLADENLSSDGENADKSEDKAEDTSDNADAVSEDADKDGVDGTDERGLDDDGDISDGEEKDGNQTDGTVDSLDDGTDAETQSQEEDNQVEQIEETLNNMNEEKKEIDGEEQNQEDLGQVNYKEGKSSMFAFAPLMLLSAAQATTMRYALYFIIGVAVGMAVAVLGVAIAFARSFKKAPKQEVKQEQPAKQEENIQPAEEVAQEEIAQETVQPVEDVVEEETETVEEPTEEPIAEEAESEDAEEEIEEEEQPEDVVEDEVTVEAVEEEPEEEPAEDTDESEDEDLIEETVEETAEEIAENTEDVSDEAVEEPVQEAVEEPADEAVEEPAEEVKEEPKKPEPVKRAPVMGEHTVVVDSKTVLIKDDRFLFNPEEDGWYYVLEKTFTAKLIQSEDIVKDYYTELKNEILSYKKVHQRMSKKRESFNFGRNCLIRMTIRGKTLRIHFALDASDYEDTKYKVEDTSSVKSLADTPLMYRIKNDRRLKYAKDLIAAVMEKFGVEKMPISPLYLDYAEGLPYEDTPPLIERGLIIKRRVRGKMPENKGFDFAKKTFKAKLIQSDDVVKDYYSQLKNYLLSYKKIHDRMSKSRESYRFGRTCVARMSIRGKTLKLYLALNFSDYEDSKYTVEDASDVKSVADTPLLIKIKNLRRLKHAMELIDAAMANVGAIKRLNADETDYTAEIPFEETDDLYDKGLITNVHVDGNSFFAQRIAARKAASEAAADEDDDE